MPSLSEDQSQCNKLDTSAKPSSIPEFQTADATPQLLSPLCALPNELIDKIVKELEFKDIISLRLVCGELARNALHSFGLCLTTVRTDLSRTSLQSLENLSRDSKLRPYVKTLLIAADSGCYLGTGFTWNRSSSGKVEFPHPAIKILQDLLTKFEGFQGFHISWSRELEDWRDHVGTTDAVAITLHIIAQMNVSVKSLILQPCQQYSTKLLDFALYKTLKFKAAWSQLEELSLDRSLQVYDAHWVTELISNALGLKRLSMSFNMRADWFLDGLASQDELPKLQELALNTSWPIPGDILSRTLLRFRGSLRLLQIRGCLLRGTWESPFGLFKSDFPLLETVQTLKIFNPSIEEPNIIPLSKTTPMHLLRAFPTLLEIVSSLGSHDSSFESTYVTEHPEKLKLVGIGYTGKDISAALHVLAKSIACIM